MQDDQSIHYFAESANHISTDQCPDVECELCSIRDCPYHDLIHYHHDGCPSCSLEGTTR